MEISEDLKASPGLFDDQGEIVGGIEGIIAYLEDCREEYAAKHSDVDADGKRGASLLESIRKHNMRWTHDFFHAEGSFKSKYVANLLKSKLPMRQAVFGNTASNTPAQPAAEKRGG